MMGTKKLSEIKQELRQAFGMSAKELDAWHRDGYRYLMGPEGFLDV